MLFPAQAPPVMPMISLLLNVAERLFNSSLSFMEYVKFSIDIMKFTAFINLPLRIFAGDWKSPLRCLRATENRPYYYFRTIANRPYGILAQSL